MREFEYITNPDGLKIKTYHNEEINSIKDNAIRDIAKSSKMDYVMELDIDNLIENSILKMELEKISKMKVKLTNINDILVQENAKIESGELEETDQREILNRSLALNLKRRGFNPTMKDRIFLKNTEEDGYNEVKKYFIDLTLPWFLNDKFDEISKRLKKAIASKNQTFTEFSPISTHFTTNKEKVLVCFPKITFNNERLSKQLSKCFLPYLVLVILETIQIVTNNGEYLNSKYMRNIKNTISLTDIEV